MYVLKAKTWWVGIATLTHSKSSNVVSPHKILKDHSFLFTFMFLFTLLLWKIQTNRQYPNLDSINVLDSTNIYFSLNSLTNVNNLTYTASFLPAFLYCKSKKSTNLIFLPIFLSSPKSFFHHYSLNIIILYQLMLY